MIVKRLRLRPAGMFSNVNEVVEQARLADAGGYRFLIDWQQCCYRDQEMTGDPWLYYFEPCYPEAEPYRGEELPELPRGRPVCCRRENIITPRLRDGDCDPLLMPRDRGGASRILSRRVRIRNDIRQEIDAFRAKHFSDPMIGLHIRGPGRNHGGTPMLRRPYRKRHGVPLDRYYGFVDRCLRTRPDARILACSDSSTVIDDIRSRFGPRVITYPAQRSREGEMHVAVTRDAETAWSPYRLGRDVLVEAELMAACDIFVHGCSNVANYVLCRSPDMPHIYAYRGLGTLLSHLETRLRRSNQPPARN
ncbi:MAG: nodulation protein NodZ [Candidatus Wenzhouxiangella sp. M2_3B_020]